jgi:8-oxo-dGTP pyrophosphatase MutT (NUDIX family)
MCKARLHVDAIQTAMEIDQRLSDLETRARSTARRERDFSIPSPSSACRQSGPRVLQGRGFVLVPASAIVARIPNSGWSMSRHLNLRHEDLPYRPCVGVMLFNREGLVFVGKRIDQTIEGWQMPQGGIDGDETPLEAALRELEEEIGTEQGRVPARARRMAGLRSAAHLLGVALHGRYRGQRQKWIAMRFLGEDSRHQHRHRASRIRPVEMARHRSAAAPRRSLQARHLCQGDRRLPRSRVRRAIKPDFRNHEKKRHAASRRHDSWRILRRLGVRRLARAVRSEGYRVHTPTLRITIAACIRRALGTTSMLDYAPICEARIARHDRRSAHPDRPFAGRIAGADAGRAAPVRALVLLAPSRPGA